jgi:hypothetical protein
MIRIIFDGWNIGMRTIPFIRLLNEEAGLSLSKSKKLKDQLVNGEQIEIVVRDKELANIILSNAIKLNVRGYIISDNNI